MERITLVEVTLVCFWLVLDLTVLIYCLSVVVPPIYYQSIFSISLCFPVSHRLQNSHSSCALKISKFAFVCVCVCHVPICWLISLNLNRNHFIWNISIIWSVFNFLPNSWKWPLGELQKGNFTWNSFFLSDFINHLVPSFSSASGSLDPNCLDFDVNQSSFSFCALSTIKFSQLVPGLLFYSPSTTTTTNLSKLKRKESEYFRSNLFSFIFDQLFTKYLQSTMLMYNSIPEHVGWSRATCLHPIKTFDLRKNC